MKPSWQLATPIDAVIFDCDSTLSSIEGIDELAKYNNNQEIVERLTREAMGRLGMNPAIYKKRLELIKPTQQQVLELGKMYFKHMPPATMDIIKIFKRLNKAIYLVSGGLYPAIAIFGEMLQIPPEHIFAVNIQFNAEGYFHSYDQESPLVTQIGKRVIIDKLKIKHQSLAFIGDGLSDLEARDSVTRFIGYGGVVYRENIASQCQFYIKTPSLAAVSTLLLTENEYSQLSSYEQDVYKSGLVAVKSGEVIVQC